MIVHLFIFTFLLIGAIESQKICPLNEIYSDCVIPCNDCQTKGKCNFFVCNKGCDCLKGYYRNAEGNCIPASLCPTNGCPANSYRDSCGSACPLTCQNYQNPPTVCTDECFPGCTCFRGYVKNNDGRCILPQNCNNQSCPANSYRDSCGSACPLTCENYRNPPTVCTEECVPGCPCNRGYVKTKDGRCILPRYCNNQGSENCPANSHQDSCGSACPLTCQNYQNPPTVCTEECIPGCYCNEGYVKSKDGRCILPRYCKNQSCPANSHRNSCGSACPLTCQNYQNPPTVCNDECVPGCHCNRGYAKTNDGRCILPIFCKNQG